MASENPHTHNHEGQTEGHDFCCRETPTHTKGNSAHDQSSNHTYYILELNNFNVSGLTFLSRATKILNVIFFFKFLSYTYVRDNVVNLNYT